MQPGSAGRKWDLGSTWDQPVHAPGPQPCVRNTGGQNAHRPGCNQAPVPSRKEQREGVWGLNQKERGAEGTQGGETDAAYVPGGIQTAGKTSKQWSLPTIPYNARGVFPKKHILLLETAKTCMLYYLHSSKRSPLAGPNDSRARHSPQHYLQQ